MSDLDPIHRILYVDDEADVGLAFARTARRLGFEADLATSGNEALRLARTRFYAVVVTDLRMPGLDGLSLIERLSPLSPSTAFVIATGLPELDLRASRQVDGAIASVIAKPWDDEELAGTLQQAFSLHQHRASHGRNGAHATVANGTPAILLVEDNTADADLTIALLAVDYPAESFTRVTRLRTALERIHGGQYEIIIADLSLPDARGFDVITRLQAAAPATPIIIISGLADDSLAQQVVALGAQDVLVKGAFTAPLLARALRYARERKRAEQRLMQLAHHDQLTGLANRTTFHERVGQAITRARRRDTRFAVLYLDLDKFKAVNDTMGHDAGDTLLEEVGRRIRRSVRDYDTVARLGGDEFAILVDDLDTIADLNEVTQRLTEAFIEPVVLEARAIRTTCSVGIAMYPDAARTTASLVKCADKALYQAKRNGRDQIAFYDPSLDSDAMMQSALSADLNVALKRGEFGLHFQPQVNLRDNSLEGFEALLRWRRGEEIVPPSVFVPLLEESGGIIPVGHWAVRDGVRRVSEWRRVEAPNLRLALNLSLGQLEEPGLADTFMRILKEHGLPPEALELEITEQLFMRDTVRLNLTFVELKQRGMRLAVKGFGTGFASREFLSRFGVDCLKISRKLVSAAPDDHQSAAVLRAIVALGESLGIQVLAEGVETREQLKTARLAGCQLAQGFIFGRPMPDWTLPSTWEPQE